MLKMPSTPSGEGCPDGARSHRLSAICPIDIGLVSGWSGPAFGRGRQGRADHNGGNLWSPPGLRDRSTPVERRIRHCVPSSATARRT